MTPHDSEKPESPVATIAILMFFTDQRSTRWMLYIARPAPVREGTANGVQINV